MLHTRIVTIKHGRAGRRSWCRGVLVLAFAHAPAIHARPLATLRDDGYVIRRALPLTDDYHGCRRHAELALARGGWFACETNSFRYVPRPTLLLLDNPRTGDTVLLAPGGEELVGTLERVPGLPPRFRVATGDTAPVPKPDAPEFIESGGVLATQPILPTASAIGPLERAYPAIAPFHDDGVPHRHALP